MKTLHTFILLHSIIIIIIGIIIPLVIRGHNNRIYYIACNYPTRFSLSTLRIKKVNTYSLVLKGAPSWNIIIIKQSNNNFCSSWEIMTELYTFFHDNISLLFSFSSLTFFSYFLPEILIFYLSFFLQVWHAPGLAWPSLAFFVTLLSPPQQSLWWHNITSLEYHFHLTFSPV